MRVQIGRVADKITGMLKIPPYGIVSVVNGTVRLDGGAMFGVVPKVLWEPLVDVDDHNRILLATRTLIAVDRVAGRVILVDTGCGTKWSKDKADRFGITTYPSAVPDALAKLGCRVEDVTDVVITHLHFDHAGGLTDWVEPGGEIVPKYPSAAHWVHRRHWEHAQRPASKDRPSFLREDFESLERARLLHFVDSEASVWVDGPFPGMSWYVSTGHTPFQIHPLFGAGDERLLFAGDLVPTSHHLRTTWVMAYDVMPLATIAEKEAIYGRCVADGISLAFPHDPSIGGVRLEGSGSRIRLGETLPLGG